MTGRITVDFTVGRKIERQIPAAEVWDLLQETGRIGDEFGPGSSVQLCGTISLKLDGEELLGPDYWVEIFNLIHLAPLANGTVEAANESVWNASKQAGALRFERNTRGGADFSLAFNKQALRSRALPMQALADAWTCLWFRVHRLAAELGDERSISATQFRDSYFAAGYFDQVDPSAITFATQAPLEEVLSTPKSFG